MLTPAYDYNLGHPVGRDLVAIGKCNFLLFCEFLTLFYCVVDGNYPAMAVALSGGKVLIH